MFIHVFDLFIEHLKRNQPLANITSEDVMFFLVRFQKACQANNFIIRRIINDLYKKSVQFIKHKPLISFLGYANKFSPRKCKIILPVLG